MILLLINSGDIYRCLWHVWWINYYHIIIWPKFSPMRPTARGARCKRSRMPLMGSWLQLNICKSAIQCLLPTSTSTRYARLGVWDIYNFARARARAFEKSLNLWNLKDFGNQCAHFLGMPVLPTTATEEMFAAQRQALLKALETNRQLMITTIGIGVNAMATASGYRTALVATTDNSRSDISSSSSSLTVTTTTAAAAAVMESNDSVVDSAAAGESAATPSSIAPHWAVVDFSLSHFNILINNFSLFELFQYFFICSKWNPYFKMLNSICYRSLVFDLVTWEK